jgi:hypothetical protein
MNGKRSGRELLRDTITCCPSTFTTGIKETDEDHQPVSGLLFTLGTFRIRSGSTNLSTGSFGVSTFIFTYDVTYYFSIKVFIIYCNCEFSDFFYLKIRRIPYHINVLFISIAYLNSLCTKTRAYCFRHCRYCNKILEMCVLSYHKIR